MVSNTRIPQKGLLSLFFHNKTTKQTIVKNTFWLTLADMGSKFLLFIMTVAITRYLGVVGYGKYTFALAYASLFGVIPDFGFNTLVMRDIARDATKAKSYISNILGLKIVLSMIAFGFSIVIIQFLDKPVEIKQLIYLATIYIIVQAPLQFYPAIILAFEKMQYLFLARILTNFLLVIFVLSTIWFKLGIGAIIVCSIVSILIANVLIGYIIFRKITQFTFAFNMVIWKDILVQSLPFFANLLATTIFLNLDTNLLSFLTNDREVGLYQSAYKFLFVFQIINVFHLALFPQMAKLWKEDKSKLKRLLMRSVLYSLLPLAMIGIAIPFIAPTMIMMIYGEKFLAASPSLIILIWSGILSYLIVFPTNFLVAAEKQMLLLKIVVVGMLINVGFNVWLIPKMGAIGAALAFLCSQSAMLVIFTISLIVLFTVETRERQYQ